MSGVVTLQRRRELARARTVTTILLVALIALVALSLSYGTFQISVADVVRSLAGQPTPPQVDYIVQTLRLPRAITGVLAALELASAVVSVLVVGLVDSLLDMPRAAFLVFALLALALALPRDGPGLNRHSRA